MRYRWIDDISDFGDISGQWDDALVKSGSENPFLLSDFIITWWKCCHRGRKLRIFVIYDNDTIVGGLPLYLKRGGLRDGFARILTYIGDSAANYTEPLIVSGDVRFLPIFMDAVSDLRECDAVYLNDVRADGIFLLSEYGDLGKEKGFFMFFLQDHMNYAIDLSAGKDEYMKSISRKLRKDLRSKRKHAINNYGPMRLKKINGREEIEKYFELYLKFSGQAFVSRNKTSIFSDGEIATFFREFLVSMDRKDRLTAHVFFGGDTVMAISFAYRFGRGFKWILTGFNYDCKDVRPGYLFIEELISEMCNMGETHCNCYGHATFYKKQWCNRQEPLYRVFLVKKTARGMVYRNLKYAASALKSKEILVKVK